MTIPLRCYGYVEDDHLLTWWITIDRGHTFWRTTDWRYVSGAQLIQEAHGKNDVDLEFPANQKARYRARH